MNYAEEFEMEAHHDPRAHGGLHLLLRQPKEKGAPFLSRLSLGLDLKGGIHLVLRVVTDDALNQELRQDSDRIAQELRSKNIPFVASKKGNGYSVELTGIDPSRESEARTYLESTYNRKYSVRSTFAEGKTNFSLTLTPSYIRDTRNRRYGRLWRPSGAEWMLWAFRSQAFRFLERRRGCSGSNHRGTSRGR